jgi:anti-sigma regulatory factor (Ser/Thr protein kinase)
VRSLAIEAGLSATQAYQLRLATEELFVNTIEHGYGTRVTEGNVIIEADVSTESVWVRMIDTAAPFDPFRSRRTDGLDLPLRERNPGALGLFLVRRAVDVAFHKYIDGANRTTIAIWRDPARRATAVRAGRERV